MHAPLAVGLSEDKCSHALCLPGYISAKGVPEWRDGGVCQLCTRRRRPVCQRANARTPCACRAIFLRRATPHPNDRAAKPVRPAREVGGWFAKKRMLPQSLSTAHIGSVCRAQHLLRRAHPNGGNVESVSFARDVGSWFAREQMLARSVRAGLCFCGGRYQTRMAGWGACQFCTRSWQSVCQGANALPFCAEGDIRMAEMVGSVIPAHAAGNQLVRQRMLAQSVPPSANSPSAQTCYHQSVGYGGRAPMIKNGL